MQYETLLISNFICNIKEKFYKEKFIKRNFLSITFVLSTFLYDLIHFFKKVSFIAPAVHMVTTSKLIEHELKTCDKTTTKTLWIKWMEIIAFLLQLPTELEVTKITVQVVS